MSLLVAAAKQSHIRDEEFNQQAGNYDPLSVKVNPQERLRSTMP
ncbi:hypothetical protein ACF07F_23445 [Streptomyces sp. NPDC015237]